jgi:WD40 repeat protein
LPFSAQPTASIELPGGCGSSLALDDAGKWIAVTDAKGSVHLFELTGETIAERRYVWESPSPGATRVALSSDGDWLLVGTADGGLHMFNRPTFIATNRAVWSYPVLENAAPTGLAITRDGSELVALYERSDGGSVYLLGNCDGAPHLRWVKQTKHTPTVAKIGGGADLESGWTGWIGVADADPRGSSGNFYVFESATGLIAGAHSCTAGCWALALDEHGSKLVGGSDDGSVYAFELP